MIVWRRGEVKRLRITKQISRRRKMISRESLRGRWVMTTPHRMFVKN